MDFEGKVVIVTGAGVGIGYGICEAFARQGASVILNDIDDALAENSADKINQSVGKSSVTPYPLDVADSDAIHRMFADIIDRFSRVDVVVANAGISHFGTFLDYTAAAFDRVVSVNLRGTYFTAQAAARAMIDAKVNSGRIILMSSVTGEQAYPNLSAYGMTKAGISHLSKTLAVELGQYKITANTICPGATLTERTHKDDPNYDSNWASVIPTGRVGYVEDIAATALFLASAQASQITGQTLIVDGGWTLLSPIPKDTPDLPEESSKLR